MREQPVGIGKAAVGERKLRVFDHRLLEKLHGLVQALFGSLIEMVAALQVEIASGEIVRLFPGSRNRVAIDLGHQLVGDPPGDRFLSADRIALIDIGRFGPQVVAARAVDEVNRDAQLIARRSHAAGNHQRRFFAIMCIGGVVAPDRKHS